MFYSFFELITKIRFSNNSFESPTKKGCFTLFCPYPRQSPTKKAVFLYFRHNPNQSLATKAVFSICVFFF